MVVSFGVVAVVVIEWRNTDDAFLSFAYLCHRQLFLHLLNLVLERGVRSTCEGSFICHQLLLICRLDGVGGCR